MSLDSTIFRASIITLLAFVYIITLYRSYSVPQYFPDFEKVGQFVATTSRAFLKFVHGLRLSVLYTLPLNGLSVFSY